MDNRKFQSGAVATPPAVPATPSTGYPTSGSATIPPTVPGDYWFHQIGEELRSVIIAAGLTPSNTNLGQLLASLTSGFGLAKSHAANGFQTLPGGLILQWGSFSVADLPASPLGTNFSFPVSFTTSVYAMVSTPSMTGGFNVMTSFQASVTSLSGAQVVLNESSALFQTGMLVYWMALGK